MNDVRLRIETSDGMREVLLDAPELSIGRTPENALFIDDPRVSRRHALVRRSPQATYEIVDLGSSNGTYVNGARLTMPATLRGGDKIRVGSATIEFVDPSAGVSSTGSSAVPGATSIEAPLPEPSLIGTSPAMAEAFRLAEKAAGSPIAVLIQGETGTGKELFARAIHSASPRAKGPFIPVNCAALPESLMESELFGHRRGAFTGATDDRKGLFEEASGGTIFLDEIGEMAAPMQAKLLRVLQESAVTRVGENRPRPIDTRVVSATNRDLASEIEDGSFRQDLFYRLAAFRIDLPPLRKRREDIPLLAERLVAVAARRHGRAAPAIDHEAMAALGRYDWPGNVRELQNELDRAVAVAPMGAPISISHLSIGSADRSAEAGVPGTLDPQTTEPRAAGSRPSDLREARAEFEARHILDVLEECGGNVAGAARTLGLSRSGLLKKIKEVGITVPGRQSS